MPLILVATPIGDADDISLRGLKALKTADCIIVEERKEGAAFLRHHGISGKTYEQLNEHSTKEDLSRLLELTKIKNVALITDCGTPGFADPGADLVHLCRQHHVPVQSLPGASSLMNLLSLSGRRIDEFHYRGFLPTDTEIRNSEWQKIVRSKIVTVIMDTPYRLQRTLSDLSKFLPEREILLGLQLTQEKEQILSGQVKDLVPQVQEKKAEFILLIYPAGKL